MSLTKEDVLKLAKLARIEYKDEEVEKMQKELNDIFNHIDKLNEVNTDNIKPLIQINSDILELREDEIKVSLSQKEAMKNSPETLEGLLIVPKVVGGNE